MVRIVTKLSSNVSKCRLMQKSIPKYLKILPRDGGQAAFFAWHKAWVQIGGSIKQPIKTIYYMDKYKI